MNKVALSHSSDYGKINKPINALLQRKCSCGNKTSASGECSTCKTKHTGLQKKLALGSSNDRMEIEADQVANKVMASSVNTPITDSPPRIQRASLASTNSEGLAPSSVTSVLNGSGKSIEPRLKRDMETRFNRNFSSVRFHTGSNAYKSARDINARAYTVGSNVVFGEGQYSPNTNSGKKLIAHELTHVVQQTDINENGNVQRSTINNTSNNILQRHVLENDPGTAPATNCPLPPFPVTDYVFTTNFSVGGSNISPLEKDILDGFKTEWNLSPIQPTVRVDGFASKDGSPGDNWPLSCERAMAVASELNAPTTDGKPGIDAGAIEFFANGETELFSASSLEPNRVAGIHAPGMAVPTSREPSVHDWSISASGSTAPDNCCTLCPINLGVDTQSPDFQNAIELTPTIRDHDPTYSYDIKRTIERKSHRRRDLPLGLTGPWENYSSRSAGSDDDSRDIDECLVPTPSGSTHNLRVIDTPGFSSPLSNSNNALAYLANFIEFVRIQRPDGSTFDDTLQQRWHSKLLIEKVGGTFSVDTIQSEIGPGHQGSLDP